VSESSGVDYVMKPVANADPPIRVEGACGTQLFSPWEFVDSKGEVAKPSAIPPPDAMEAAAAASVVRDLAWGVLQD
jgi:hypothetical protein